MGDYIRLWILQWELLKRMLAVLIDSVNNVFIIIFSAIAILGLFVFYVLYYRGQLLKKEFFIVWLATLICIFKLVLFLSWRG